jgi:hypothetical protein
MVELDNLPPSSSFASLDPFASTIPTTHNLSPVTVNPTPAALDIGLLTVPMVSTEKTDDSEASAPDASASKASDFPEAILPTTSSRHDEPPSTPQTTPPRRMVVPRPNCTHISMDVLHDSKLPCDFCGRASVLGWLFQCQQDVLSTSNAREQLHSLTDKLTVETMSPVEELEAIGMSESIVDQFKKGTVYEPGQIEMLKAQKLCLQQTIEKLLDKEREPWNTHTTSDAVSAKWRRNFMDTDATTHPNVTMRVSARKATLHMIQKMGKFRRRSAAMARCTLKCCQSCRPYFKDRAYMSFDSVFANEIGPLESIEGLPIADVAIVRQLGLRPHPPHQLLFTPGSSGSETSSSDISYSSSSDSDEKERDNDVLSDADNPSTPDTSLLGRGNAEPGATVNDAPPTPYMLRSQTIPPGLFMANAFRSVKTMPPQGSNLQQSRSDPGLLAGSRSPQTSYQPTPTSTPIRGSSQSYGPDSELFDLPVTDYAGSSPDFASEELDFDHGLQRISITPRNEGSIDLVAAAGLRNEIGMGEWLGSAIRRGSASSSAYSDEVLVDGGVALTEEAVETQTPDIITQG